MFAYSLTVGVASELPRFTPDKVRLRPPVVGPFSRLDCVMTGASYVNRYVVVPTRLDTVRLAASEDLPEAGGPWHLTDDSDFQEAVRQAVEPMEAVSVGLTEAKLYPVRVIDAPPVAAMFHFLK
jgi:hypothetical protein